MQPVFSNITAGCDASCVYSLLLFLSLLLTMKNQSEVGRGLAMWTLGILGNVDLKATLFKTSQRMLAVDFSSHNFLYIEVERPELFLGKIYRYWETSTGNGTVQTCGGSLLYTV